jgi:hypothetical protein
MPVIAITFVNRLKKQLKLPICMQSLKRATSMKAIRRITILVLTLQISAAHAGLYGCLIEPSQSAEVGAAVIGVISKVAFERGDIAVTNAPSPTRLHNESPLSPFEDLRIAVERQADWLLATARSSGGESRAFALPGGWLIENRVFHDQWHVSGEEG